jgi:transposase
MTSNTTTTHNRIEEEIQKSQEQMKVLQDQLNATLLHVHKMKEIQRALQNQANKQPIPIQISHPLKPVRKITQRISDEVRHQIAKKVLAEHSMTYKQATDAFGVCHSSVYNIVKQAQLPEDQIPKKNPRGRKSHLNSEHLMFCLDLLDHQPQLTLDKVLESLHQEYPQLHSSVSALSRELAKMEITWKTAMPILTSWNSLESLEKRNRVHHAGYVPIHLLR